MATFPRFSELPAEIRCKIWQHIFRIPRLVRVECGRTDKSVFQFRCTTTSPYANQEAHHEARKIQPKYMPPICIPLCFPASGSGEPQFFDGAVFNPEIDTIILSLPYSQHAVYAHMNFRAVTLLLYSNPIIQTLAMDAAYMYHQTSEGRQYYPGPNGPRSPPSWSRTLRADCDMKRLLFIENPSIDRNVETSVENCREFIRSRVLWQNWHGRLTREPPGYLKGPLPVVQHVTAMTKRGSLQFAMDSRWEFILFRHGPVIFTGRLTSLSSDGTNTAIISFESRSLNNRPYPKSVTLSQFYWFEVPVSELRIFQPSDSDSDDVSLLPPRVSQALQELVRFTLRDSCL